ncbi:unnamed protein product [Moneuplotes crassus]|uniref:DUF4215 domain-containing protein n=1 Tax=Euplotes crassus TaxID=5936 RepID=A0AAD1XAQ9_EUPCR|nr:unnamed protein product [Moneuplotes crassus]
MVLGILSNDWLLAWKYTQVWLLSKEKISSCFHTTVILKFLTIELFRDCGNGYLAGAENCDDGNWKNGDGCNQDCNVENTWTCNSASPSVCERNCTWNLGTNPADLTTECYDENTDDGDGCDKDCEVEEGYVCEWDDSDKKSECELDCGDGKKMSGELCDDGDKDSGDGCSDTCEIEQGYTCENGSPDQPDTCHAICGDGIKLDIENCDDNNTVSDDGCDSTCTNIEDDYECTGGSMSQPDTCNFICGNGKLLSSLDKSEHCDDDNTENGDGCNENCKVESGWECTGGSLTSPSSCKIECIVEGCAECESGTGSKCQTCENGYQLMFSKKCRYTVVAEEVQTLSSGSQAASGAGSLIATLMSLLNSSSPMAIWSMANQMQLLMLLLLTQASLPADVVGYISGNQMFSFNMNFLPIKNNMVSKVPLDWLKQNQTNIGLGDMGMESGSSFNNNFGIICTLLILVIFHCLWSLLPRTIDDDDPRDCKEKTLKFVGWIWKILTFGVYIRLVLEAYQNILLSSFNEIKNFEPSSLHIAVSTTTAVVFVILMSLVFYWALKQINRDFDPKQHSKSKELVAGLKDSKAARLFTTLLLLRRFVFCVWLIMFSFTGYYYLVPGMLLVQVLYTSYMIVVRSFKEPANNVIECLNEIFYVLIVAYLMKYNTKHAWTSMSTKIYIYILMLNNIVVVSIISVVGIAQLCKKLCGKKKPDTFEIPQIIPPKTNARRFNDSNIIATSDIHLRKFPRNSVTSNPEDPPISSSTFTMDTRIRRMNKIMPITE